MSTPIENNTEELEEILRTVNALPNASGGGGGVSVQADWNQTNETAADFIKNKPFGEIPVVVYEGTDLSPENEDGAYLLETPTFDIVVGARCTVVLDGVVYEAEGISIYDSYILVGNPAAIGAGEDNGMPFVWMHNPDVGVMMFISFVPFSSLRISASNVKKISTKYYDTQAVFHAKAPYLYTDFARTIKATKADVLAVLERMPIVVDWTIGRAIAFYVHTADDYATINFYAGTTGSANPVQFKMYTAEYTE